MFWLAAGLCLSVALCVISALVFNIFVSVRRLPPTVLLALLPLAFVSTLKAQKPNGLMQAMHGLVQTPIVRIVTDDEIARGWRVESFSTDAGTSLEMPSGASLVGNWHVHGACTSFGSNKIEFPGFSFPLGTNSTSSFWYFVDGCIRPTPRDELHEIRAAGGDMFAAPGISRLWTEAEPDGSRVITWESFFMGEGTNTPVSAQIRLCPNGDMVTRSNSLETVYSRVNPRDFDGDGIVNERDANQYFYDGDFFGPSNVLPAGAKTNAYCTVSVVATGPDAVVEFSGDAPSDYDDPLFVARSGVTNDVLVLVGKTYTVTSDWPVEFVGSSDPETEMSPLRSAAMRICRPVSFSATEGTTFAMTVDPANLGGVFEWDSNVCCGIAGSGRIFSFQCPTNCPCSGCTAFGEYIYEGYSLPVEGGRCPCASDGPEWLETEGPQAASVSVEFSAPAVIFEDAYENAPGEAVARRSTRAILAVRATGGESGVTLSVSSAGMARLARVSGHGLPSSPVFVPPGLGVTYEAAYEGIEASASAGDVSVSATAEDAASGAASSASSSLTSVRLELSAVWEAPENPCTNRHVYGVGEKVRFRTFPGSVATSISLTRINERESYYDMMDALERIYICPVYSATPNIKVVCSGTEYKPAMSTVEPASVLCKGAAWDTPCLLPGVVGGTMLSLTNFVGPMNVSFRGIMVAEIPCVHTNMPTGFFAADYTGQWTHWNVEYPGAAKAFRVKEGNYWTVDRAGHPGEYVNWSAGRLEWDIPIGWFRMRFDDDMDKIITMEEFVDPNDSGLRKMLIGGRIDAYKQVFSISEDGTASVEKHGHTMSRSRFCRVWLDGITLQWVH